MQKNSISAVQKKIRNTGRWWRSVKFFLWMDGWLRVNIWAQRNMLVVFFTSVQLVDSNCCLVKQLKKFFFCWTWSTFSVEVFVFLLKKKTKVLLQFVCSVNDGANGGCCVVVAAAVGLVWFWFRLVLVLVLVVKPKNGKPKKKRTGWLEGWIVGWKKKRRDFYVLGVVVCAAVIISCNYCFGHCSAILVNRKKKKAFFFRVFVVVVVFFFVFVFVLFCFVFIFTFIFIFIFLFIFIFFFFFSAFKVVNYYLFNSNTKHLLEFFFFFFFAFTTTKTKKNILLGSL